MTYDGTYESDEFIDELITSVYLNNILTKSIKKRKEIINPSV